MKILKTAIAAAVIGTSAIPAVAFAAEPMQPSGAVEMVMSKDAMDFFESAASANMFEIQASQLAATKSSDPKIKSFAEMMVTDHTEASAKLKILADAKKVTLPTTLLKRHQMMLDALSKDKNGRDFDRDYENKMVLSHKEAVSLFDKTAKTAKDSDVKQFAVAMLPKLQMHGGMANELNKR